MLKSKKVKKKVDRLELKIKKIIVQNCMKWKKEKKIVVSVTVTKDYYFF